MGVQPGACFMLIILSALGTVESTISIQYVQAPPVRSRFTTAVFRYLVLKPNGYNVCRNKECSISCELDGQALRRCPASKIVLRNLTVNCEHKFLLSIETRNGDRNSSMYSWFIDTTPPTAIISSKEVYTSAEKIAIDITLSEPCTGRGGFTCLNSSNCKVLVDSSAVVQASSLRIIQPNIRYSLDVILPLRSTNAHVVVRMADRFCTDQAGNLFARTNGSVLVIHLDRRPVYGELWMSVPSYMIQINEVTRTVFATNNSEDLQVFLDFSGPISNSTEDVIKALEVKSGIIATHGQNHANRRFAFRLKNTSAIDIITVQLHHSSLISRTATQVAPVAPLTFLYGTNFQIGALDITKPGVTLSTSSHSVTRGSNINVIAEFTKPVFGFQAEMVKVVGGRLVRFQGLSKALYSMTILPEVEGVVSIVVAEGKVNDISGNPNLASNLLAVEHYAAPAVSLAITSFVTVGVLATSFAASLLSVSSANLGVLKTGGTSISSSKSSTNLHGMIGHLQVYALSDWFLETLPPEFSETTKGLSWLIPREKLPWKQEGASVHSKSSYSSQEKTRNKFSGHSYGYPHLIDVNLTNSSQLKPEPPLLTYNTPKYGWMYNFSMKAAPYGLPLDQREYFIYFLRGEPLSATTVIRRIERFEGWPDVEMNMVWLGIGGGSLLLMHALILLFLKWRTGTHASGLLSVPRFEIFLLIIALPCISQSSAFAIRGGTIGGIIFGAFLIAIPAAFIISVNLFLTITIFCGSVVQYKEILYTNRTEPWCTKLWVIICGRRTTGEWFYREGLPSTFLQQYGILFENRKGPPIHVFADQNDNSRMPKWVDSGHNGIGRMRAISSDASNEETRIPISKKLLGCAQSSYIVLDLLRRVCLGILSGIYASGRVSQSLAALSVTLVQFLYLVTLKPYIRRGVYVVESISLLSEVGMFGIFIYMGVSCPTKEKTLGSVLLMLFFLMFVSQIINEWYSLMKWILRLSPSEKKSFKLGLKYAAKGLILPFLSRTYWSRVISESSQPSIGLAPVVPLSLEQETERRDARASHVGAMTATVVPMITPGSPSPATAVQISEPETTGVKVSAQRAGEGRRLKGIKLEPKSDLVKLRELAKASFSGGSKSGVGSTSYAFKSQSSSTSSDKSQPSFHKTKH